MNKIIVFGSVNTDLVISSPKIPIEGETLKGQNFFTSPGGKGANQAVAASLLGGQVELIGCVGNDYFGIKSLDILKSSGVGTSHIHQIEGAQSGIAMVITVNGDNRIILDSGANRQLKVAHFKQYINQTNVYGDLFVTQLENDVDETIEALKVAKKQGMTTIFNPAPAVPINQIVYQSVDILVLNQSEAQILTGIYPTEQSSCQAVYKHLSSLGVKTVIITLGALGSVLIDETDFKEIKGYLVPTIDTTGAGDAYIGALSYGMSNGFSVYDSMILASQVSALVVMKRGAQIAMPTLNEVRNYFNKEDK